MIGAMDLPNQTTGEPHPPTQPLLPTPAAPPPPDPGSRGAAVLAWLVLLVVLPLVIVIQQLQAHDVIEADPAKISAPAGDSVEVSARMGTRMAYKMPAAAPSFQTQVDQAAETPLQRFRAAITAGELDGPEEAAHRLGDVIYDLEQDDRNDYDPDDENDQARKTQLLADAETLRPYYRDIAADAGTVPALDESTYQGLEERHGFFAELARIARLPKGSEERKALLDGALVPFGIMALMMAAMGGAVLVGLGLGITALVLIAGKRVPITMDRPAAGGSVYLETAVLFVVCFALLQLAQVVAAMISKDAAMVAGAVALPAQWLLLLVPLWPLARGVSWSQIRDDLGLRAPRGVMTEVFMGAVGYLALLPILLAGIGVMLVLLLLQESFFPSETEGLAPANPMLEMVRGLDPVLMVLFFTLATIWAPLCEELVFRGALFRHMRARLAMPLAAVFSALVFGMMHGYAGVQLIPVIIIGFNFALIRAWRGSLYGCIAGHALNNAVVLSLLFAFAFVLYG